MKTEADINIGFPIVDGAEDFNAKSAEVINPDVYRPRKKYCIVAIPQEELDGLKEAFGYIADDMSTDDFDESGQAKSLHEDETVSDFLKKFISVSRVQRTYKVTVEFTVEADTERDAENEVENAINGYIDYEITDTTEED